MSLRSEHRLSERRGPTRTNIDRCLVKIALDSGGVPQQSSQRQARLAQPASQASPASQPSQAASPASKPASAPGRGASFKIKQVDIFQTKVIQNREGKMYLNF